MASGDIAVSNSALPTNLDDLSKFVLIGREKLIAVRAEIRAIDKVGLAQEVREQKLREAQDISEAVLDAEVRIGELMAKVPKKQGFASSIITTAGENVQTKAEIAKSIGLDPKHLDRFETLAAHPDIVEQAKAEARENDDIVSRSSVLSKIREETIAKQEPPAEQEQVHRPHVTNNSGNNEWYTPAQYIELAREVLGEIDLDPASCELANETVQAERFFTVEDDALAQEWIGKVWMNPPYSTELITKFTEKFVDEFTEGRITEGIVLVNNATETAWFVNMANTASAVVFPRGRIRYLSPSRESLTPLQGQAFLYFGDNSQRFLSVFRRLGWGAVING